MWERWTPLSVVRFSQLQVYGVYMYTYTGREVRFVKKTELWPQSDGALLVDSVTAPCWNGKWWNLHISCCCCVVCLFFHRGVCVAGGLPVWRNHWSATCWQQAGGRPIVKTSLKNWSDWFKCCCLIFKQPQTLYLTHFTKQKKNHIILLHHPFLSHAFLFPPSFFSPAVKLKWTFVNIFIFKTTIYCYYL